MSDLYRRMPDLSIPDLSSKLNTTPITGLKTPQFITNAEQGVASEFCKRLMKWIEEFNASIDDEYEIGIRLVNFGQAVSFRLENLRCWDPYLISFSGVTEDGNPVELIQHVNQISILLMKIAREDLTKPKQPIGFYIPETT